MLCFPNQNSWTFTFYIITQQPANLLANGTASPLACVSGLAEVGEHPQLHVAYFPNASCIEDHLIHPSESTVYNKTLTREHPLSLLVMVGIDPYADFNWQQVIKQCSNGDIIVIWKTTVYECVDVFKLKSFHQVFLFIVLIFDGGMPPRGLGHHMISQWDPTHRSIRSTRSNVIGMKM